jgi:hypothetical protein
VRLLHESFLDDFSAWRTLKSLRVCVRAVDAGSNWDRGNYIIGVEEDFHPARKTHPALAVHQIDLLFALLTNAGVKCVWERGTAGVRRFHAHDPWGNRLEFTESTCS